jgi:hypothetical protein
MSRDSSLESGKFGPSFRTKLIPTDHASRVLCPLAERDKTRKQSAEQSDGHSVRLVFSHIFKDSLSSFCQRVLNTNFGRSGSIRSNTNFDDPSLPSCMMPKLDEIRPVAPYEKDSEKALIATQRTWIPYRQNGCAPSAPQPWPPTPTGLFPESPYPGLAYFGPSRRINFSVAKKQSKRLSLR